jgi:FkbM family methyltransferase
MKRIITALIKIIFGTNVTAKPFHGTNSTLYYEKAQHLVFLFKRKLKYEPVLQKKIKPYCNKATLVFDIGANIGQYALLFSEIIPPQGKVISLEPDQKNFSFLQFNTTINHKENIVCLKKGVSYQAGSREFFRDTETGGRKGSFIQSFVGENYQGHRETVETVTLDQLIAEYGEPQFIKIDVEGFEAQILRGLTTPLTETVFLVEVRKETKNDVFEYFQERGYTCYYMDKKVDERISDSSHIPDFANLLFKRE